MKIVTCILARGGSKGIPRKNLYPINKKPMIYYTIDASLKSNVHETWLSTEDKEIKEVAEFCGANVIDRPYDMSTDFAKNEDALLHFAKNVDFDILVYIQPTSPLLSYHDINKGISKMMTGHYDSVFTVFREHWIPRWTTDIKPIDWHTSNRPYRQQVPEKYVENGAFYMTTRENLLKSKLRYSGNIGVIEMPFSKSIQVDTEDELQLIDILIKARDKNEKR